MCKSSRVHVIAHSDELAHTDSDSRLDHRQLFAHSILQKAK